MTARRPTWIYDGSTIPDPKKNGARAVDFLRRLRHPKSTLADHAFDLAPFWERITRRIYGPVDEAGRRIVKTAFILMPRGARKTTYAAGLGLLHTFGYERTPDGSVVAAAAAEDQSLLAFDEAHRFVKATPWLRSVAKVTESGNLIEHERSGSAFLAVSSDGDVQLGKTPAFVLADELAVWRNRTLWRALRTGLVKTPGTLLIIITQAGRGTNNLAHELYDYARRVESGAVDDPGFLPVLFESDPGDDWQDERIWHTVNPGLEMGFPDLAGLRQLAREAAERPADRDDFRQFHLNCWLEHSVSPFVDMGVYDAGADPVDLGALEGEPCWLAADLSTTTDLSVVVACWRDGDDYIVWAWFFCPADNLDIRSRRDKVPYARWAEAGFITPTEGNVIDYRAVEKRIRWCCEHFDVREIAFDKAYAQPVMAPLLDDGLPVITMQQGWVTQAPAVKELERAIVGRHFRHGGHPVLRWNFENIAVHTDSAGNRTFHKGKSRDRIDGATAAWMAVARASAVGGSEGSIYDDPARYEAAFGRGPAPQASEAASIDYAILQDSRHPRFAEMRERWEAWRAQQPDDDMADA
jgi:phage terminase large subunit-like protein